MPALPSRIPDAPTPSPDVAPLRVLLVEDNPGDVDLVRIYLGQELDGPIALSCAGSLAAAREALDGRTVDLVLLDLGLPDGTGLDVVGAMRRMVADAPIVVVLQPIRELPTERVIGFEALTRGPPAFFCMPADLFRAAYEQNTLTTLDLRSLRASLARVEELEEGQTST